jgi:endo-1,3(4)-beta-glucanase
MGKRAKTSASLKKYRRWAIAVAVIAVLGGLVWWFLKPADPVSKLQQRSHNGQTLAMTQSSQAPPTNKWFSSLAFKQPSDPVFAYPLALQTTITGFDVSYPRVTATADTIDASFTRDVSLVFGSSAKSFVRAYDDLSVEIEVQVNATAVATARITQGSPYVFMQLKKGARVTLDAETATPHGQTVALQRNGNTYELYMGDHAIYDASSRTLITSADTQAALYIAPAGADMVALREAAKHPIAGTEVSYKINEKAETSFTVHTTTGQPTIFGLLPEQMQQNATVLGRATTLLGTQHFIEGTTFSFNTPLPDMTGQLPIQKLDDAQKSQLSAMVKQDAGMLKITATDSYYAGKELYRAAQLLQLAKQLGLQAEAATIQRALQTELSQWLDPNTGNQRQNKFFYYDTTIRGVVGVTPSFGSEDFNDHHFHYGYFLYAAGILAQYDAAFVSQYGPQVTMLARDIANTSRDDANLPYLRVFDQYAGHSWASGFAPFGSGNNQESSSEAVNAWQGMYMWAKAVNNTPMQTGAQWLFARESQAALTHYVNIETARQELAGYAHSIVSLLWGGKADYATFFDAAPESKLAIQLIPMSPASDYLAVDKARILQNLANLRTETGQPTSKFKDYIAMYKALADPKGALVDASYIGDADIDGANSRSYLYAWLFTHQ